MYGRNVTVAPRGKGQWRKVREDLGVPEVTSHSFRKSMADLIDGEELSARVGADQLGHAKISMSQDKYMSLGRVHAEVAELLDRTIKARYRL
jgi:integrase